MHGHYIKSFVALLIVVLTVHLLNRFQDLSYIFNYLITVSLLTVLHTALLFKD